MENEDRQEDSKEDGKDGKPQRNEKGWLLPGHSGNPRGPKKGSIHYKQRIEAEIERMLKLKTPLVIANTKRGNVLKELCARPDMTNTEAVGAVVMVAALQGEQWAIRQLLGDPDKNIDIKTNGEKLTQAVDLSLFTDEQLDKITDAIFSVKSGLPKD